MFNLVNHTDIEEQNSKIIANIHDLLSQIAYDSQTPIKLRFRKSKDSSTTYIIELSSKWFKLSDTIELQFNPFNRHWSYLRNLIKQKTSLRYCRHSKYGGYTFY